MLLSLLLSCSLTTLMTAGKSHPELEGAFEAKGLAGKATITRDDVGIPHIRAGSESDAAFAMGYVHAQDRFFQMDLTRSLAYGDMTETFQRPGLADYDVFMRGLDLRAKAAEAVAAMDPSTRFVLAAYAAGVNAALEEAQALPLEHRLLKHEEIEPWTPADSLAVTYLNSWHLAGNPSFELFALEFRKELDRKDLDALYRVHEDDPKTDAYWAGLQDSRIGDYTGPFEGFLAVLEGRPKDSPEPEASNNWVVSGERSEDGSPILANDPHLGRRVPSTWYIAEWKGGDVHVAGATLPGQPWVVSGHNETLSWGVTNVMADYVDFVMLEREGADGYWLEGQQKTVTRESIDVALPEDGGTHTGEMVFTEIGPVVTEVGGTHLVVLRWHALEMVDESTDYVRMINTAATVEEARAIPPMQVSVGLNFVLADTEGDIAWQQVSTVPIRRNHTGRVPYPGSSEHHGWDGFYDLGETPLPGVLNPEEGYVASANHRPALDEERLDPSLISTRYIPPWRYDRINALIEATPKHTVESIGDIQMDQKDTHFLAHKDHLATLVPQSEAGQELHRLLTGWSGDATPADEGPTVWAEFQKQVLKLALKNTLDDDGVDVAVRTFGAGYTPLDTEGGLEHWFEDPESSLRSAMLEAHKALTAAYGEDTSAWKWGDVHPLIFAHPFGVNLMEAGEVDCGGTPHTVNPCGFSWSNNYETTWIASVRIITPMSDVGKAEVITPPGQSGNVGSDHYQDMLRRWSKGRRVPLWFHDADVERNGVATLELSP